MDEIHSEMEPKVQWEFWKNFFTFISWISKNGEKIFNLEGN
jgi:hypothetical protein